MEIPSAEGGSVHEGHLGFCFKYNDANDHKFHEEDRYLPLLEKIKLFHFNRTLMVHARFALFMKGYLVRNS